MISEKERQNRDQLFKLMQENPELPVVPVVESEVVGDRYEDCRWLGNWGDACLGEYCLGEYEEVHIRDDSDAQEIENTLIDSGMDYCEYEDLTDDEVYFAYTSLPWTKAIIVYINTFEQMIADAAQEPGQYGSQDLLQSAT